MKKFALAVLLIAFGAVMVAGCPTDNTGKKTDSNTAPTNEAPANS